MKLLLMCMSIISTSMLLLSGCGDNSGPTNTGNSEAVNATSKSPDKPSKKAPPPRKKVSDKEAAKLLLAQTREMMELVGMPKSAINDKMFSLEMDVRDNENNLPTVVKSLRRALDDQGQEPCVSESNEVLHVKTEYEKVVLEYAKSRNQVGTDLTAIVFAFRSLPEDEQEKTAAFLARMMEKDK